jgi:hypothetical protein
MERQAIVDNGGTIVDSYSLVSNYGYMVEVDGKRYDIRHWLNVYGASCDIWTALPDDSNKTINAILEALRNTKE